MNIFTHPSSTIGTRALIRMSICTLPTPCAVDCLGTRKVGEISQVWTLAESAEPLTLTPAPGISTKVQSIFAVIYINLVLSSSTAVCKSCLKLRPLNALDSGKHLAGNSLNTDRRLLHLPI